MGRNGNNNRGSHPTTTNKKNNIDTRCLSLTSRSLELLVAFAPWKKHETGPRNQCARAS